MTSNISPLNTISSNAPASQNNTYGSVSLQQVQGDTESSMQYKLSKMKNKIAYSSDTSELENKGKNVLARW